MVERILGDLGHVDDVTNAVLFSFLMTSEQIPQQMIAWVTGSGLTWIEFLLIVNLLLLIAGNVMDNACKYGGGKVWVSASGGGASAAGAPVQRARTRDRRGWPGLSCASVGDSTGSCVRRCSPPSTPACARSRTPSWTSAARRTSRGSCLRA